MNGVGSLERFSANPWIFHRNSSLEESQGLLKETLSCALPELRRRGGAQMSAG